MRTICPDQHASGCMYVQNDQNMHSSIYSKPTGSCIGEQIRLPSAQAWQRICSSYRPEDKFSESATFDVDTPKFRFGHFQKFCDKGEGEILVSVRIPGVGVGVTVCIHHIS